MKPNQVLPELVMATLSISLWFTPKQLVVADVDISRLLKATGLATSTVFYAKAYLMLVCNWSKFTSEEQKEEIDESVELEIYEYKQASELAKKKLEIDNETFEKTVTLINRMAALESAQHPEVSESEREAAAKRAIESALSNPSQASVAPTVVQEHVFRQQFPETLDQTSWKAILKALQSGAGKDEIIKDVLGCNDTSKGVGDAYFEFLKRKFIDGQ